MKVTSACSRYSRYSLPIVSVGRKTAAFGEFFQSKNIAKTWKLFNLYPKRRKPALAFATSLQGLCARIALWAPSFSRATLRHDSVMNPIDVMWNPHLAWQSREENPGLATSGEVTFLLYCRCHKFETLMPCAGKTRRNET